MSFFPRSTNLHPDALHVLNGDLLRRVKGLEHSIHVLRHEDPMPDYSIPAKCAFITTIIETTNEKADKPAINASIHNTGSTMHSIPRRTHPLGVRYSGRHRMVNADFSTFRV